MWAKAQDICRVLDFYRNSIGFGCTSFTWTLFDSMVQHGWTPFSSRVLCCFSSFLAKLPTFNGLRVVTLGTQQFLHFFQFRGSSTQRPVAIELVRQNSPWCTWCTWWPWLSTQRRACPSRAWSLVSQFDIVWLVWSCRAKVAGNWRCPHDVVPKAIKRCSSGRPWCRLPRKLYYTGRILQSFREVFMGCGRDWQPRHQFSASLMAGKLVLGFDMICLAAVPIAWQFDEPWTSWQPPSATCHSAGCSPLTAGCSRSAKTSRLVRSVRNLSRIHRLNKCTAWCSLFCFYSPSISDHVCDNNYDHDLIESNWI